MPEPRSPAPAIVSLLIVALTSGIFALDLATPLGWADGFLYMIPLILILFRSPQQHYLISFAVLCTGLILLGWIFSPPGGAAGPVTYNRTTSIALLWVTALFLRHRRQVEEGLRLSQEALEIKVEERTAEFRKVIRVLKCEIAERKQAEEALRQSEERLRLLMGYSNDAILYIDLNGAIQWVSHHAEVMTGRPSDKLIGRPVMTLLSLGAAAQAEARLAAVRRGQAVPTLVELEFLRPDGVAVVTEANITSVYEQGRVAGRLLVARDITERKQAETALRESEQRLSQLLKDRERISRDLHDNIIQMLYAIGLGLEESHRLFGEDSKTASSNLSNAIKALNAVIRDVRSYITWSEPNVSDGRQLKTAIERLAQTMEGSHLLHFRLKVDQKAADRLTHEEASHVLYIVREAMSNTLRHSQARNVVVLFQAHDGHIQLQVKDDGIGFDTPVTGLRGQGLLNIAARAKELGAKLQIASQPGHGSSIVLDIPKEGKHVSV